MKMPSCMGMGMSLLVVLVCFVLAGVLPWTEAHPAWEGTWKLSIGKVSFDKIFDCRSVGPVARELKVTLESPDKATDQFGNKGYWSSISAYALEIVLQGRKFFYYPVMRRAETNSTNSNNIIIPRGWSHDLLGNNWACFSGIRSSFRDGEAQPEHERNNPSKPLRLKKRTVSSGSSGSELFRTDHDLISAINQGQSFWTAKRYPEFENMTIDQMINMAGGKDSLLFLGPGETSAATDEQRNATALLPKNWDWRNVNGKNFVSPVRSQGNCGSCYAFAVTAVIESRVRILTNNKVAPIYSPQDIVDCSAYSNGCNGGNMFAIGKYGEDYGYADESCSPYKASEKACTSVANCKRSYAVDYELIGSRSGGCNDLAMQLAIYYDGPIGAGYTAYTDFRYYKSGIYYHYGTNNVRGGHAVTVVGWGEDERTGTKYWIVKNSWGSLWGENGYFRIIRGLNDCGFEGRAFQSSPIL